VNVIQGQLPQEKIKGSLWSIKESNADGYTLLPAHPEGQVSDAEVATTF